MKIKRPALRYHGGKWLLAKWIISFFPKHTRYTEVFGGAASVLLQKKRCHAEVYNDIWNIVVNLFEVLRDPIKAKRLEELLRLTPFARKEFEKSTFLGNISDPIEKARMTIFRSFAGFGSAATNGEYATGFRSNSNRSGTTPARNWNNYPNNISALTQRLKGVVIESRPAIQVLKAHDCKDTLHYIDPPYVHETRTVKKAHHCYAHELTDEDHVALLNCIIKLKGMVILSGYRTDLYDDFLLPLGWQRIDRTALADGANKRIESIWMNPLCIKNQPQKKLF